MRHPRLLLTAILCLTAGASLHAEHPWRFLHNNDGTDLLSNIWHGRRPISVADVNECVDLIAGTGVTTYLMCTGSDFAFYRSRYARVLGDDEGGSLDSRGDTLFLNYYRNHRLLEQEGTDIVRAALSRARARGMETMITYRMNDLHFSAPSYRGTVYSSRFWNDHPELWMSDGSQGWNSNGALDFARPEVQDHKYAMLAEQLDLYGALIDGLELDFMRMIVYFRRGEGPQKAPLLTDLVRRIRVRTDSLGAVQGRKILLTARVPVDYDDALAKGLDVQTWVDEGLVDFLTLGVHWCGDPAIDVSAFRARLGKAGRQIPIYATLDDGGFAPREIFSHGTLRGSAEYALAHGADGIYLFNYFLAEYLQGGREVHPAPGTDCCRTRSRELLDELGSLRTLRGRNKIFAWRASSPEFGLHSRTPLPLDLPGEAPLPLGRRLRGKDRPREAVLLVRLTGDPAAWTFSLDGRTLPPLGEEVVRRYGRLAPIAPGEKACAYAVPVGVLSRRPDTRLTVSRTAPDLSETPARLTRLELVLNYGDPEEKGWF
ncbi:MAG: hypothetical protein IJ654_02835 [Bacteroidales bacterium]|nr:hypothetical protein [Bacteroidales bacterium]